MDGDGQFGREPSRAHRKGEREIRKCCFNENANRDEMIGSGGRRGEGGGRTSRHGGHREGGGHQGKTGKPKGKGKNI